ncbi:MAG TPA: energy transducer TonB [Polyangiaceae bacterium]
MTSLAGKVGLVGVSAGLHAAVLFTSLGHPARAATDEAVETDVTLVEDAVDQAPVPVEPKGPAGAVAWHTHTHPYPVPPSHDLVPHDPNLVHTFAPAMPPTPTAAPAPEPAPAPVLASDEGLPHFHMALGNGDDDDHGAGGAANGSADEPAHDDVAPLPASAVDGRARLVQGGAPEYPASARADGIEGSVGLELVVGVTGGVESARVVRGVGHGLDEAALAAAHRFHFAPATRAGHAVRVRMAWSVEFRLAD